MEVWQTSNLQRLRLGEEKKRRRRKKKPQHENIYVRILLCRAAITRVRLVNSEVSDVIQLTNRLTKNDQLSYGISNRVTVHQAKTNSTSDVDI